MAFIHLQPCLLSFSADDRHTAGPSIHHLNTALPGRGARVFKELATRHASHSNGSSRFELELDRRNAARGNAGSRVPRSIDGAQVGVRCDYHKTQPAQRGGTRAGARAASFPSGRGGNNRSVHEPDRYDFIYLFLHFCFIGLAFIEQHFTFQNAGIYLLFS